MSTQGLTYHSTDHVVDSALDHLAQSQCLVLTSDYQHDLSSVHDSLHADGESHTRHSGEIVVEESAVVQDGLVR